MISALGLSNRAKQNENSIEFSFNESQDFEIYDLIGPHNNGKLIELMQSAHATQNYEIIDSYIRKNCSKYVLNNGIGDMVL